MRAGDTVYTPPGEQHRHGATTTICLSHIAMLEGVADGDGTTWLEPGSDEQHDAAGRRTAGVGRPTGTVSDRV